MKNHAITMLEVSAAVFLFLAACWHAYESYSRADHALETAHVFTREQSRAVDTMDIHAVDPDQKRLFQGSEVMYMISGEERNYDITVNGIAVPEALDPDLGDWEGWPAVQPAEEYHSAHVYSTSGVLERVDFYKAR